MPTPTVGRIVHYVSYGTPGGEYKSTCRAAVVTEVDQADPELVGLAVLNPGGLFFNRGIPQDELVLPDPDRRPVRRGGTWHWPERVDDGAG